MKKKIDKVAVKNLKNTVCECCHQGRLVIEGDTAKYFFDSLSFEDMEKILSDYIGKPVRVDEEATNSYTKLIIRIILDR